MIFVSTTAPNENKPNASGLTPDQTRSLPERAIHTDGPEPRIIRSLRELYSCTPQDNSYEIYAREAVFRDPIGITRGIYSIRAQFDALPKLFPRSEIQKLRVLKNPPGIPANLLLIDQDVAYFRDAQAASPFKVVNSLLTLRLDDTHQVTSHIEEWDHNCETTVDDGFLGMLNEHRKRMAVAPTNVFVSKV
ncbi:hypothetical protein B0F90DRAFT_148912 [Multifurca ochricompacta]|uniref:Uncharacterized protein n=1 Tax=Multifurca ochricompacta TaxID=376703 RepID=A0AAD4MDR1_9AGAM|nr:hypothetical protein B0F90DRAFT_148912 [Multifurca ochricompacta]